LVLVSIEKINQTLKTVSDHNSKHLEVRQKYSRYASYFQLSGVWKCVQSRSVVFDILFKSFKTILCYENRRTISQLG